MQDSRSSGVVRGPLCKGMREQLRNFPSVSLRSRVSACGYTCTHTHTHSRSHASITCANIVYTHRHTRLHYMCKCVYIRLHHMCKRFIHTHMLPSHVQALYTHAHTHAHAPITCASVVYAHAHTHTLYLRYCFSECALLSDMLGTPSSVALMFSDHQ